MRLPLPPAAVLSPGGHSAAVSFDRQLALVTTRTGERRDLALPAPAQAIAFARGDRGDHGLAVVVEKALSWLPLDAAAWPSAPAAALPGTPFRLALGHELAAVVARTGERTMALCAFRLQQGAFEALGESAGRDLGALAAYQLLLNENPPTVALRGLAGRQALSGEGAHFVLLMEAAPGYSVLWKGGGLPFVPDNLLYPLAGGALAAHNRTTLVQVDLTDPRRPQVNDSRTWPSPLETTALSPDGAQLAWMWAGEGTKVHLRVAPLAGPEDAFGAEAAIEGNFPALAVDDEGIATLVWGSRPDLLHILRVGPGLAAERQTLRVPAEPDLEFGTR